MATLEEWLGGPLYKAIGSFLVDELGADEPDDLLDLQPQHLEAIRAMLKPLQVSKFERKLATLQGGGAPPAAAGAAAAAAPPPASGSIPEGVPAKPATREVHSAAAEVASVDVSGALDWTLTPIQPSRTSDFLPALCIFGSMRFPVPLEARLLFAALQAAGVHLKVVDMRAGQDIDKEVYEWIEHCHAFLAFGTKNYGEDTGNSACTYNEVKFAQAKKKNIILLRMIPWEQEFEELQARVLFNRNMLTLEWQQGQTMPPSLVGEILKAMDLPATGAAGSPAALAHETAAAREAADLSRAQAEAAKAQAQAQLAEAQASAAAAKAQAEAAQAQAQTQEAMAMAAAEEEAARRVQEEARAAEAVERQRKEHAERQEQRAGLLSELETAEPARVVEILRPSVEDAEVQAAGWAIVWRRSDVGVPGPGKANAYGSGFAAAGGMAAMADTLRHYSGVADVLEHALRAAYILCRQVEHMEAFISAGGMEAVIRCMEAHVGSASVQEHGCGALINLLTTPENKAAATSAGCIQAVLTGMAAHIGSAQMQRYGFIALKNLASGEERIQVAIASAGGIEAVLQGMVAHDGSVLVQKTGLSALWNLLVNNKANKDLIVAAGGIPVVRAVQSAHLGNEVQAKATKVLKALSRH